MHVNHGRVYCALGCSFDYFFVFFQENTILGASNDFASRVWSLTDHRVRVRTKMTCLLSEIYKLFITENNF